jgi:hypothetical protein
MTEFMAHIDALIYAGDRFKKVAEEYKSYIGQGGFERPTTGEPRSDDVLGTTLQLIDLLHGAIADATWQHGQKLQLVAERYQGAENMTIAALMQATVTAATTPADIPEFNANFTTKM